MNSEPPRDAESVKYERFSRLEQQSEELLMSDQAYDVPSEYASDMLLRTVVISAPQESTLYRLGYRTIMIQRAPETREDGVAIPQVIAIQPTDKYDNELPMYHISDQETEMNGVQPVIMKETGEDRPIDLTDAVILDNLDEDDIEDEREVTGQEELELRALLLACRDLVTFPSTPDLAN